MHFEAFVEDIRTNHWNVHGVEVYENGRLLHRYGDTDQSRFPIYSATKTITSVAAGMAFDRRKIDLNPASSMRPGPRRSPEERL